MLSGSIPCAALAAAGLLLRAVLAQNVTSLAGNDWTVSNLAMNISVPGSLPSQAHLDLYAAQVIGNPYWNLNDFSLRWVALTNWTYTSAPISGLSTNADTWLLFNGLDTFTSISFCGQYVASTDNQFRQYWFDVSDILQNCSSSDSVVAINFGAAPTIANEIAGQPGQETWPYGVQQLYEFDNRYYIRKEQSDFGWDWGPSFSPAGPWQPAWIVQLQPQQIYVRNSIVDIYRNGQLNNLPPDQTQPWVVNASIDYFGQSLSNATMSYTLTDSSGTEVSSGTLSAVNVTNSTVTGMTMIDNDLVDLWWPTQMGSQTLYNMTINVADGSGQQLANVTKRLGFRTIVLNELPISQAQLAQGIAGGNNWHFEINGQEFYAKGSNFIPPDAFWPRVTPQRIQQLFESVIEGNQNMLRVWASGAYSPDFMYDLADEMGILLWSEFEFGDALYPVDQEFLDNVQQEVEYQVRRTNHHPSLALWAGGNELESLELQLVNDSAPDMYDKYLAQYEILFIDVIATTLFQNSRSISYEPSSTQNGWLKLNVTSAVPFIERLFNMTPGDIYGDSDFYDYDASILYNDTVYPVGRFANEFGFHSMPSVQSWQSQISADQLSFNSSVVELRNHHFPAGGLNISNYYNSSLGMGEMTDAVEMWYPMPNKTNSAANFSAWCWATQVFQADLYKSEIQFYRRGSGLPERQLGSLYWQLEDIWVAPTWASIEYDGRWKVLHSVAKDIYQQVIIAPYFNFSTTNLSVWVTSDLWQSTKGQVSLDWYDWSGNRLNVSTPSTMNIEVGALNTTRVLEVFTNNILGSNQSTNAVLKMQVTTQGQLPNSNSTQTFNHANWFTPSALKNSQLVDPGLQLSYTNSTKEFTVTATKGVAAWVWLDYPAGAVVSFSNNAFWLGRGESQKVTYNVKNDTTGGDWIDGVTVQSLWNQTLAD